MHKLSIILSMKSWKIYFYAFPLTPRIKAFNTLGDYWLLCHATVRHSLSLLFVMMSNPPQLCTHPERSMQFLCSKFHQTLFLVIYNVP